MILTIVLILVQVILMVYTIVSVIHVVRASKDLRALNKKSILEWDAHNRRFLQITTDNAYTHDHSSVGDATEHRTTPKNWEIGRER